MGSFLGLFFVGICLGVYFIVMRDLNQNPRRPRRPSRSRASSLPVSPPGFIPKDGTLPALAEPLRYVPQGRIMSENEAAFFRVLRSTFGESYLIFAQLPLDLVISPERGDPSSFTTAKNKIDRKTVDFVLVHPETMAVIKVIELNDSSHNRRDRQERDNFVRDALKQADVPFVEIRAAASYNAGSLGPLLAGAGTG